MGEPLGFYSRGAEAKGVWSGLGCLGYHSMLGPRHPLEGHLGSNFNYHPPLTSRGGP